MYKLNSNVWIWIGYTFGQNWQLCITGSGFSVWFLWMCCRSASFKMNDFGQWSHLNGRSPLCVIRWRLRISFCMNDRLQTLHLNGFSPVCTRMWRVSVLLLGNHFWQYGHSWPFDFALWSRSWLISLPRRENVFGHLEHANIFKSPDSSRSIPRFDCSTISISNIRPSEAVHCTLISLSLLRIILYCVWSSNTVPSLAANDCFIFGNIDCNINAS